MSDYVSFLQEKSQLGSDGGFEPIALTSSLFDFQESLVTWALRKGRAAVLADCGLGKSPIQLSWADNVVRKTNKPVLILTPLAVSHQTVSEAAKFGIEAVRSSDGTLPTSACVVVTNYERLHYFNRDDFAGVVCDESSILKNFEGATRSAINEFMRTVQYRLLCTATAAPNDYIELGTSSEALGGLGYVDMLGRFFKNDNGNSVRPYAHGLKGGFNEGQKWRLKGHAELPFWQWVCSWARALRKPSDLGFSDERFVLPPLNETEYMVAASRPMPGMLFVTPAVGLKEQREERRRTIGERCAKVAELVNDTGKPALVWCHLNPEGDLLEKLIPDAVQVSGKDSDDEKEEKLTAFANGQARVMVIKPVIGGWGLNLQHCAHVTFFPSNSYEQHYQGVRRCWRFGQKNPVQVDIITSQGEQGVLANLRRKSDMASQMFDNLIREMHRGLEVRTDKSYSKKTGAPKWLSKTKS